MAQDAHARHSFELSVLCLNLRFGLAEDGANGWHRRRRSIAPLLAAFPCDFYAFQEANDFQVAFLDELLPDHRFIGLRQPAPEFWQNNVLFYHQGWTCEQHDHFYLSHTPDIPSRYRDSRWPRQCTWGLFARGEKRLICVNTHFDFDADVQVRSAGLIARRLNLDVLETPVILMGDLNASPDSECLRLLKSPRFEFRSSFGPPYQATHHGFSGRPHGEPIDWILYRGGIERINAQIITRRFAGLYPSDHFPLTAEFQLP